MKNILIIYLFTMCSTSFAKDPRFFNYCQKAGGIVYKKYQCPKSKLTFSFKFCVFENQEGEKMFFDGCTGPTGNHYELFMPHCIKHDLCYHHEPSSNGKTQKDCDRELYEGLRDSCRRANDVNKCENWAAIMYRAVRTFGKLAYECADYTGEYEDLQFPGS